MKLQQQAFTLVEIIVAIMVFLIGVSGVYAIIQSTINVNNYNRDFIIATNLAREQIELVRNIRDTNIAKIQAYDILEPNGADFTKKFEVGKFYTIANDFSSTVGHNVKIAPGTSFDRDKLQNMRAYQVCRSKTKKLYDYCSNISSAGDKIPTNFYKYIEIIPLKDENQSPMKGFIVKSEVVWRGKTVHSFYIDAIFTDNKTF